ncbi:MAG: EAL domain-containing protein [Pseudomonadota bacterium]
MKHSETTEKQTPLKRQFDGSWIAEYGDFTLKSALQPIFRFSKGKLRPVAFEGLLRPYLDETPVLTGPFLQSIASDDQLRIETLARTLHVRNANGLPQSARRLFLNFDPSLIEPISAFETILQDLGTELRISGLSPVDCVCEITEKAERSRDHLSYFIYALRARGYRIAVDDFGSEASDMSRIEQLTPDIVKFDGGMIKSLMDHASGLTELKRLVAHFQSLRIDVILEGLEEMWQIEMAEAAGADMVQGFAAAVPRLAPADFSEWFKDDSETKLRPLVSKPATG